MEFKRVFIQYFLRTSSAFSTLKSWDVKKLSLLTCTIAESLILRIMFFVCTFHNHKNKLWCTSNEGWQDCQRKRNEF
jgi:hypothetical protein